MILLKVSKSKHVQISLLLYLVVNSFLPNVLILYPPLPKNLYKNYKMDTKIIQNTKFVYILYTKIVQIKTLYDNECTRNIHQIPTYIQKKYTNYKTCTKFRPKTASNLKCLFFVQTVQNQYNSSSNLKQPLYVFCTQKQCTNYIKRIQMLIESYILLLMYVFCICKDPTFFTFEIYINNNGAIFCFILQFWKMSRSIFLFSKRFTNEFIL